jgi:hypothetical protein
MEETWGGGHKNAADNAEEGRSQHRPGNVGSHGAPAFRCIQPVNVPDQAEIRLAPDRITRPDYLAA